MDGETTARQKNGLGLLLLSLLMFFFLCLAYIARYDGEVVCRFVDGGEQCAPAAGFGLAKLGAWMSIIAVVCAGLWLTVPKSAWRSMLTSDSADAGITARSPSGSGTD